MNFLGLESLPWEMGVFLIVTLFVSITVAGIILVHKLVNLKTLKAHHDVAGFVFTNLGTLYAVLLGFTVVNVQQRFDKLKDNVEIEASYLAALYRDSEVFSKNDREIVRSRIKDYVQAVVNYEWETMAKGNPSPEAQKAMNALWHSYYALKLEDQKQQAWYQESISKLNSLVNTRLARILGSSESLSTEMWSLLIIGGLVMMTFNWFFGVENYVSHLLIASVLAASAAFMLFLIYSLDTAFLGQVSIPPEAFTRVMQSLEG